MIEIGNIGFIIINADLDILQVTHDQFVVVDTGCPFQHTTTMFFHQSCPILLRNIVQYIYHIENPLSRKCRC